MAMAGAAVAPDEHKLETLCFVVAPHRGRAALQRSSSLDVFISWEEKKRCVSLLRTTVASWLLHIVVEQ